MFFFVVFAIFVFYKFFSRTSFIDPKEKFVLITGCDSGFGRGLAIDLDRQGFRVFAGIFNETSRNDLEKILSRQAVVFRIDITKQNDIDAAFQLVSQQTSTLHALVNNAGIGACGYIDWVSIESIRQVMDVNFFGHVTVTKKFLPLLISKRDSRVINVCSAAGFVTKPGMVSYSASKYAFESFSDCLRREMAVWGLKVSIIEPGFMKTPIVEGHDRALKKIWDEMDEQIRTRWGKQCLDKQIEEIIKSPFLKYAENPKKVIRSMKDAVMNVNPQIRYRPGWQSSVLMFSLSRGPAWLADLIIMYLTPASVIPNGVRQPDTMN